MNLRNVGTPDRFLRALFASIVAALFVFGMLDGLLAIILGTVAAVLLATSLAEFCPIYFGLKLSTRNLAPDRVVEKL